MFGAMDVEPRPNPNLLPDWYMPAPAERTTPLPVWCRWVAILIIAAFVLINAYGLCSTYGHVGFG